MIYLVLIILLALIFCAGFLWQDFHIGENEVVFARSKLECKICSKNANKIPGTKHDLYPVTCRDRQIPAWGVRWGPPEQVG